MEERLEKVVSLIKLGINSKRITESDLDFIVTVITMLLNEKRDKSKYEN